MKTLNKIIEVLTFLQICMARRRAARRAARVACRIALNGCRV